MGHRIGIITDSVADLPAVVVEALDVKVVPIHLLVDGQSYRGNESSLDRQQFQRSLRRSTSPPQTAAPSYQEFILAYQALAESGVEAIVGLFVASQLSSIFNQARYAAELFQDVPVRILETGQVSMGVGWQVVAISEAVKRGAALPEIEALAHGVKRRTHVVGVLGSLEHLRRSGRVGWAQATVGDLLQIKPVIEFYGGEARLLNRVRTQRRGVTWLIEWVRKVAPVERLALLHTGMEPGTLNPIKAALQMCVANGEVWVVEAGPVFLAHIGPTGIGVAVVCGENKGA
ncbi:MAG: DegV family protein [Anaerolineae bacterium]|nr:DegV family protein [Anaerolineae bacterium]